MNAGDETQVLTELINLLTGTQQNDNSVAQSRSVNRTASSQQHSLVLADEPLAESLSGIVSGSDTEVMVTARVAADFALLGRRRWPLVVICNPTIDTTDLTRLLARLRDLHGNRIVHIQGPKSWSLTDSLALGFVDISQQLSSTAAPQSRTAKSDGKADLSPFRVFQFDIGSYKQVPDWLNAKHWANPELWGKHRW